MRSRAGLWAIAAALLLSACAPSAASYLGSGTPETQPAKAPMTTTTIPTTTTSTPPDATQVTEEAPTPSAPTSTTTTTAPVLTEEDIDVDVSGIDDMLDDLDRLLGDLDASFNQNEGDVTP